MHIQPLLHSPDPLTRETAQYLRLVNRVQCAWDRVDRLTASGRDATRATAHADAISRERLVACAALLGHVMSTLGLDADEADDYLAAFVAGLPR